MGDCGELGGPGSRPRRRAVIPNTSPFPVISSAVTLCAGVVLGEDATIGFTEGCYGLYIVGEGDLDGDGVSDRAEIAFGDPTGERLPDSYDADHDKIANFAETDSDNDGASDACEFAYLPKLNPYVADEPDADYDMDGYSNAVECAELELTANTAKEYDHLICCAGEELAHGATSLRDRKEGQ